MTELEYDAKQHEVERLLNDPHTPMRADRIWALLEDLARSGPVLSGVEAARLERLAA